MKTKSMLITLCMMLVSSLLYAEQTPLAKVKEINNAKKEILIAGADLGNKLHMGNIVYVNINNEDVKLIVVFPMLTVSKCRLLEKSSSFLGKIPLNTPVYRKPLKKTDGANDEREGIAEVRLLKGTWKEYWDPDGNSDVTYHDHYIITPGTDKIDIIVNDENGSPKNQNITDVSYKNGELSLKLFTSFEVKYTLRLDKTGKWLLGSAVTPNDTYLIKWEQVEK